jgi:hypothetical protein
MHPLTGGWIANIDQSRRDPNHQFSRATMRFELDGTQVTLIYGGVNASGRQEQGAQTLSADGHDHPVAQAPGVVVNTTLAPHALHSIARKDGQIVGRGIYEVAEDGRTMTATVSSVDASGQSFGQVIVFDRE